MDAQAAHLFRRVGQVHHGGDHRVATRGEIGPVLVDREGRTGAGRFAEQLGVVQHDVRAEQRLAEIEERLVEQRLHPAARVLMDVVRVQDRVALLLEPLRFGSAPGRVDVLAARLQLRDHPVEVLLEPREQRRVVDASGMEVAVTFELGAKDVRFHRSTSDP